VVAARGRVVTAPHQFRRTSHSRRSANTSTHKSRDTCPSRIRRPSRDSKPRRTIETLNSTIRYDARITDLLRLTASPGDCRSRRHPTHEPRSTVHARRMSRVTGTGPGLEPGPITELARVEQHSPPAEQHPRGCECLLRRQRARHLNRDDGPFSFKRTQATSGMGSTSCPARSCQPHCAWCRAD
jgi:hypothetical protein